MCKAHRQLYKNASKFPSQNIPKSTRNPSRKPSQTTLRKSEPKKHRKIEKVPKMTSQRGVPGWPSNVIFAHFRAPGLPWGPSWLPDLAQGPPGPVQTWIFVHLGQFFVHFGWNLGTKKGHNSVLFFTYFCSPGAGRVR